MRQTVRSTLSTVPYRKSGQPLPPHNCTCSTMHDLVVKTMRPGQVAATRATHTTAETKRARFAYSRAMIPRVSIACARLGADGLLADPVRTLLSTLGVIIGVASLVAVLSLGDGTEATARSEIARLTDVQTVGISPKTVENIDGQSMPLRN